MIDNTFYFNTNIEENLLPYSKKDFFIIEKYEGKNHFKHGNYYRWEEEFSSIGDSVFVFKNYQFKNFFKILNGNIAQLI